MSRRVLILTTVIVAVAIVAAILLVPGLGGTGATGPTNDASAFALDEQPRKGDAAAPVDVVVFEDFLCPHCGTFAETIAPRIERDYVESGDVAYHVINFVVIGPESQRIAEVAECIVEQGHEAYWAFERVAYRSQSSLSRETALELADEYVPDLDREALDACLDDGRGLEAVQADVDRAIALGVTGTPSAFVNGRQVRATYPELSAAIDAALADTE